jgi:hypothetical protein
MTRKCFAFSFAALAMTMGLPAIYAQPNNGATLSGTWMVNIQIKENVPPGARANFRALHTYSADGRFADSSTQLSNSAARGEWHALGKGRFAVTFVFFSFTPAGDLAAVVTVRTTLQLDESGNSWSGPFTAQATSPDGAPLGPPATGTHSGQRVVSDPLPN